ncbi:MAG: hypothetical protein PHV68_01360 [Candidatus Gastranaerophilales bacterium]|nr:hypothetical protein [Candidatus Gastranaerophilales bacterium]
MTDDNETKIVKIFNKHNEGKMLQSDEGYGYVKIKHDNHGKKFDGNKLVERSKSFHYIIRVMVKEEDSYHIYNYNVTGEKLMEFLLPYTTGENSNKIIEIEKYYPHGLA